MKNRAEYFDKLETRSQKVREAALMSALPKLVAHAQRNAPGFSRILANATAAKVKSRDALARLPVTRKSWSTSSKGRDDIALRASSTITVPATRARWAIRFSAGLPTCRNWQRHSPFQELWLLSATTPSGRSRRSASRRALIIRNRFFDLKQLAINF